MPAPHVSGIATVENGTHERPERDLAAEVLLDALGEAGLSGGDLDGLYMPKPRPWTPQKFFSTLLTHHLGLDLDRTLEVYSGGTSAGSAFRSAVRGIRDGDVEVAAVIAAERSSISDTDRYFDYILSLFDREFQSPAGPTIPGVYAQSLQRYLYDYGIDRDRIAEIVVKNRENALSNPEAVFDDPIDVEAVLDSRPIADPLRLYECPRPCDGAAALILTTADRADESDAQPIPITGTGYAHPPSHFIGARGHQLSELPAAGGAMHEALEDAGCDPGTVDALEPYAPFPHVEGILLEELALVDRGAGATAAVNGPLPVSPSGGCIGRGHPPMVTPLLNHIAAVRQLRGTAPNQVSGAECVLTTAEHGHVDGVNATVFGGA
ncbi:MAG: thiolase family protein [Salinirussus sp.]